MQNQTQTEGPLHSILVARATGMVEAMRFYGLNSSAKEKFCHRVLDKINIIKGLIDRGLQENTDQERYTQWLNLVYDMENCLNLGTVYSPGTHAQAFYELYLYLYENNKHFLLTQVIDDLRNLSSWNDELEC